MPPRVVASDFSRTTLTTAPPPAVLRRHGKRPHGMSLWRAVDRQAGKNVAPLGALTPPRRSCWFAASYRSTTGVSGKSRGSGDIARDRRETRSATFFSIGAGLTLRRAVATCPPAALWPHASRTLAGHRLSGAAEADNRGAMNVEDVTPILNVSSLAESFAWFERLGWKKSWNMAVRRTSAP
jgi:hypothetical protein